MTSQQSTVDFVIDQISDVGDVSAKKMFGEYGIYCGGKMVALMCDDHLRQANCRRAKPVENGYGSQSLIRR